MRTKLCLSGLLLLASSAAWAEGSVARGPEDRVGLSFNFRGPRAADERALDECGGGCRIVGRFDNACAAIATGRHGGYGWAARPRPGEAARAAIENCEDYGDRGCAVVVRGCDDR